jgi:transposase
MLNNATCFKEIHIVCGRSDLRSGIDRLAAIVKAKCGNEAFKPDVIYLFCGRRPDRIKGLVWEEDGFLLLIKRLSESQFVWPRNEEDVKQLTQQQFEWLMAGLTISPKKSIQKVAPPEYIL